MLHDSVFIFHYAHLLLGLNSKIENDSATDIPAFASATVPGSGTVTLQLENGVFLLSSRQGAGLSYEGLVFMNLTGGKHDCFYILAGGDYFTNDVEISINSDYSITITNGRAGQFYVKVIKLL